MFQIINKLNNKLNIWKKDVLPILMFFKYQYPCFWITNVFRKPTIIMTTWQDVCPFYSFVIKCHNIIDVLFLKNIINTLIDALFYIYVYQYTLLLHFHFTLLHISYFFNYLIVFVLFIHLVAFLFSRYIYIFIPTMTILNETNSKVLTNFLVNLSYIWQNILSSF